MEFIIPIINAFEKQIMNLIPRFYNLIVERFIEFGDGDCWRLQKFSRNHNEWISALVYLYEKCDINKSNYLIQQLKTNGFKDGVYIKLLAFQKLFEIYNILVLEKTNEHFNYKMSKIVSKEINYMRNYFAHRSVNKVSNEIIQRFYEDLYLYLQLVITPCDKALLSETLSKEIKLNVKIAMDVNMRNPLSFDLENSMKVFGYKCKDTFEKVFVNKESCVGNDVDKYGCSFEEFEKKYLSFMEVGLPKYEFVNEDINDEIKEKDNNQNADNKEDEDEDDIHSIHSVHSEHNNSNNNDNDGNDEHNDSRPIIENESINISALNVNDQTQPDDYSYHHLYFK